MRPSSWLRFLADNMVWLVGSLLLATFVWVTSVTEQNPVQSRRFPERIPIQLVLDDGMIVTNNPVTTAQIVLRTTSDVWEAMSRDDIQITANLSGVAPGVYTLPLNVAFGSSDRIVVESIQPEQITLTIDQAAERLVPIVPEIRSSPPTGFEVIETAFSTQEVLVSGIASDVEQVVSANVRLHLGTERDTFTRNYRLYAVDEQGRTISGVTLQPENVDVSVSIEPGEDFQEVFVVPNVSGEPADGYIIYAITYDPQTILVSGRPSDLEQLPGTVQTTPIDLTGQTESFTRTVAVELPPGVFLPTEQSVTVTVQIDTLTASRRFDHLPVQVQGLDEALQAVIAPTEVSMLITGPQPVLDTLTPGDISIIATLTDLAPGNHQIALQAIVNREGLETASISVLPPVLEVQIAESDELPSTPAATLTPTPIPVSTRTPVTTPTP